jgi:putative transposase
LTCNWSCHDYRLMDNHYHLVVETPDANLSKGMRQLNGIYAQKFNYFHKRVGHCFQGRYKAIHVDPEIYLLELVRYVVLNPVRAEMVRSAGQWPWSSYNATAGLAKKPDWLTTQWILSIFSKRKQSAIERYGEFVSAGKGQPSPWKDLRNQVYLGSQDFVDQMQGLIDRDKELSEVPISQRKAKPLAIIEYEVLSDDRNGAIVMAYQSGGYTQKELGHHFDLHYARISRIVGKAKGKT